MKLKLTSKQSFYWLPSCLIDKYSKYPSVIYHDIIPHCYRRIWHPGSSSIQHIFNGSGLGKFPILEFRSSRSVKHCFSNHKSLKYLKVFFFQLCPRASKRYQAKPESSLRHFSGLHQSTVCSFERVKDTQL